MGKRWMFCLLSVLVAAVCLAEAAAQSVVFVNGDAPAGGDGSSWETAFQDLQDALDHARSDPLVAEVWVAGGTYLPDRGTGDRTATFALVSDVALFGGFRGDEVVRPRRSERTSETMLSGDIGIPNDPSDNSKAVVSVFREVVDSRIDNMTIAHGNGTWGSGINVYYLAFGVRVTGCLLRENNSTWGGAILIDEAEGCEIIDCDFESNTANHGGALYLNNIDTTTEIVNCRFSNNYARGFGGAVDNVSSHPIFRNCTFINNSADREGGALGNNGADAMLVNCILWGNPPNEIRVFKSTVAATYSCISGGWPGEGNFDADPGLVDAANGDLRLAANSPCVDAGNNSAVPPWQTLDLDFNPRFADDAGTPDGGRGNAPIVDIGCYEFQGTSFAVLAPMPGEAGRVNRLTAIGAVLGSRVWFVYGRADGSTSVPGCAGVMVDIDAPRIIGSAVANANGEAKIDRFVPEGARGVEILMQGVDQDGCRVTRVVRAVFD